MKKLHIRPITPADAKFLYRLMNTPKWKKHIGDRNIINEEAALAYMKEKMSPVLAEKGFVNYVIIDSKSQAPVGTCSLHQRKGMPGIDIGYAILPEFERKGYATQGALAMVEKAFNEHQQKSVYAINTDKNISSCQLLTKLGFNKLEYLKLENVNEELSLFELQKSNYNLKNRL